MTTKTTTEPANDQEPGKVEYSMSAGFAARLARSNIAVALTSY